jgi:hypothetical protein
MTLQQFNGLTITGSKKEMYNKTQKSVDRQIQVDMEEDFCYMADISFSHIENNKVLFQLNNNYPNQDLNIITTNATVKTHDVKDHQDTDVDGNLLPHYTTHRDIVIALRREDGEVKFTCPTFKGIEPRITWKYRNEAWLITDFDRRTHNIEYKD